MAGLIQRDEGNEHTEGGGDADRTLQEWPWQDSKAKFQKSH